MGHIGTYRQGLFEALLDKPLNLRVNFIQNFVFVVKAAAVVSAAVVEWVTTKNKVDEFFFLLILEGDIENSFRWLGDVSARFEIDTMLNWKKLEGQRVVRVLFRNHLVLNI